MRIARVQMSDQNARVDDAYVGQSSRNRVR
jgi:hypothetical protein